MSRVPNERRPVKAIVLIVTLLVTATLSIVTRADARPSTVRSSIVKVFGRHAQAALRVAWCESRYNPRAVSPGGDVGVFQANYSAHHRSGETFARFRVRMSNVDRNLAFAHRLSRGGRDWSHWTCKP